VIWIRGPFGVHGKIASKEVKANKNVINEEEPVRIALTIANMLCI
jgi:hypothetical protein